MKSVSIDFWELLEKDVGTEPTGPAALLAIVQQIQIRTSSMVQNLTESLKKMTLKSELG